MIREGLALMTIGMSGVFVFLLLLVGLMHASGSVWVVLARWLPEPRSEKASPSTFGPPASFEDEEIAVALAVAWNASGRAGPLAAPAGASAPEARASARARGGA
ncbi:MAG: OadG family transporter subunit [Myxococcota bacterium]